MTRHPSHIPDTILLPELTLRGIVLGALITVVFTASNIYLGLKVGLTFSSAIPSAVISMAALRTLRGSNILENNMVQTQASAAGTLSSIVFVIPGLLMMGHWHGFPFWITFAICGAGGVLGVLFTIPLRRAMVVNSTLPYPEGIAAAEILRIGSAPLEGIDEAEPQKAAQDPAPSRDPAQDEAGAREIAIGGLVSAVFAFATSGLRIFSDSITVWVPAASTVFRLTTGFSMALVGAGYLIGIAAGMAILLGIVLSWGFAVPILTWITPHTGQQALPAFATELWAHQVRFIGAGTIGVAAVWTLITLGKPMIDGVKASFSAAGTGRKGRRETPNRTDEDLAPRWILGLTLVAVAVWFVAFGAFVADKPITVAMMVSLVLCGVVFAVVFGFFVAAACGYMAGLVGSSASPISGVGIVAVVLISLLILGMGQASGLLAEPEGRELAVAFALFTTSAVIAIATIANDNLQDLKTGWLVGATPWRQQVALLLGCVVGSAVVPPVLNLLYIAYGFPNALPSPGMDPARALSAPQAVLMTQIATGIFTHRLAWSMLGLGVGIGIVMIVIDALLERRGGAMRLPVIAVGIGIYLPPTVGMTLVVGAVLGWIVERTLERWAKARNADHATLTDPAKRRGVLLASGLIVGESLVGVVLAGIVGITGKTSSLAIVGDGFETTSEWLALVVFVGLCAFVVRRVLAPVAAG
jgi:putative OPT family oligopeptide transporter